MLKVSVAQAGSVLFDTPQTMNRVEALCRKAATQGARLLVLPEAMLGGYPKGLTFGATIGNRTDEGRDLSSVTPTPPSAAPARKPSNSQPSQKNSTCTSSSASSSGQPAPSTAPR